MNERRFGLREYKRHSLGGFPESIQEIVPNGEYWLILHGGKVYRPEAFEPVLLDINWDRRNDPIVIGIRSVSPWTKCPTVKECLAFLEGDTAVIVEAMYWDSDGGPVRFLVPGEGRKRDLMNDWTLQGVKEGARMSLEGDNCIDT